MVAWVLLAASGVVQPITVENARLKVTVEPSGSFSVLDKRSRTLWQSAPPIAPFRSVKVDKNRIAFETEARQPDGKTFPVSVTMWLEGDELVVDVDTDDRERRVGRFKFCHRCSR